MGRKSSIALWEQPFPTMFLLKIRVRMLSYLRMKLRSQEERLVPISGTRTATTHQRRWCLTSHKTCKRRNLILILIAVCLMRLSGKQNSHDRATLNSKHSQVNSIIPLCKTQRTRTCNKLLRPRKFTRPTRKSQETKIKGSHCYNQPKSSLNL